MNTISPTETDAGTAAGEAIAQAFEKHLELSRDLPSWWLEMKKRAFADFQRLPMPTRKNEAWRFANLLKLSLDGYDFTSTATSKQVDDIVNGSDLISNRSGQMVFADNDLVQIERISPELAEKGVIWEPLSEALESHKEVLEKYFMAQDPHLGSEKFAALHSAFVSAGCLLYIPKGVEITDPFVAYHWASTENAAILPHTLVIAEDLAKVTLADVFFSRDGGLQNLACGFNHLFSGASANINYLCLQNWSRETLGFQINSLITERDSTINSLSVNIGCSHFRSENQSILQGQGGHVEMFSLSVADGEQEIDQRTLQSHLAPNATSNLLFKNALNDKARTIFSGLIKVAEDAQKTDAYQSNRNLLLSDTAEANSLPGLEIHANDVRCTHGATTGQIDETELFYMLARGIPEKKAKELLVFGFFEEIISKIENEEMANRTRELIQAKFATV